MVISVALEREAVTRSTQQATSFAECKACFEQQLASFVATKAGFEQQLAGTQANDERIRQSLRSRQWTEPQIYSLMSPSSPSSSAAAAGATLHHPTLVAPVIPHPQPDGTRAPSHHVLLRHWRHASRARSDPPLQVIEGVHQLSQSSQGLGLQQVVPNRPLGCSREGRGLKLSLS